MSADLPSQLVIDLGQTPSFGADDYVEASANAAARDALAKPQEWPGSILILIGPPASGKSHLATIWQEQTGAQHLQASSIASEGDLHQADAIIVEDCEEGFGDETLMFHLVNEARANGKPLLLTAQTAPSNWPVDTRDLASRLRGARQVELLQPDDDLLAALFVKHCADRQLTIDAPTLKSALLRVERSYAFVEKAVALIDEEMLRQKRPLSRSLVLETLKGMMA